MQGNTIAITELLEAIMVISFGLSWPMSVIKAFRSRTAKGKSLFFTFFIGIGYVAGVIWKIIEFANTGTFKYPAVFYVINLIMVTIDIILYFRNHKLDKLAAAAEAEKKQA